MTGIRVNVTEGGERQTVLLGEGQTVANLVELLDVGIDEVILVNDAEVSASEAKEMTLESGDEVRFTPKSRKGGERRTE